MTCPNVDILNRFADATLSDHEAADLVAHLANCETCSRKVDDLEHFSKHPILTALRELQNEPIADDGDPPLPRHIAQYDILEKIGQGGMGVVYRAIHPHLKREVALKVIRDSRLDDPTARERFVQEMQSLGKLTHPNIVHATDAGIAGDTPFIVTELLDGQDFGSYIEEHGKMPVKQAVECIRQAATGLAYAHNAGYIHRDIKPSNLFLLRNGNVKILDLGIARPTDSNTTSAQTVTGHVMGSPEYMAPEQLRGKPADARSDIYSLGQTFLYMLTGKHDDVSGVPHRLKTLLTRMTAGTPGQRFQTVDELLKAVDALSRTKRHLLGPLLVGVLLIVGVITIAGQPRKEKENQINTVAPAVNTAIDDGVKTATENIEQELSDLKKEIAEQAEIDGFIAKHGADVKASPKGQPGWKLLHRAASSESPAVVKHLVSQGADVNAKTELASETPLHLTKFNPNAEVAKYLVSQGADVNAKDATGRYPIDSAREAKNTAVSEYLSDLGKMRTPSDGGKCSQCGGSGWVQWVCGDCLGYGSPNYCGKCFERCDACSGKGTK